MIDALDIFLSKAITLWVDLKFRYRLERTKEYTVLKRTSNYIFSISKLKTLYLAHFFYNNFTYLTTFYIDLIERDSPKLF